MATVSELTSKNIAAAQANVRNWGKLVYNVSEHGLLGDGVTDDTAKLQALVDLAISEGRKTIAFSSGTYFVTALTNDDQVFFVGDNASFTGGYAGHIEQLGEMGVTQSELDAHKANEAIHRVIKLFETMPTIEQLADGEIGLVLEKKITPLAISEVFDLTNFPLVDSEVNTTSFKGFDYAYPISEGFYLDNNPSVELTVDIGTWVSGPTTYIGIPVTNYGTIRFLIANLTTANWYRFRLYNYTGATEIDFKELQVADLTTLKFRAEFINNLDGTYSAKLIIKDNADAVLYAGTVDRAKDITVSNGFIETLGLYGNTDVTADLPSELVQYDGTNQLIEVKSHISGVYYTKKIKACAMAQTL